MLREAIAVESRKTEIRLSPGDARSLMALGRELAAAQVWWGSESESEPKSVVEAVRVGEETYEVTFRDVTGVVRIGGLQIRVRPKIPEHHFAHLVSNSSLAPRTSLAWAATSGGSDYASLLATWCVAEAELLLRRGLRFDYSERGDELSEVRGRLNPVATSLATLRGRPVAVCEFDDFNDDSPVNRVVKAACQQIAATTELEPDVRKRARRVVLRMGSVSALLHGDRITRVTRLTSEYDRVLPLAHLVLQATGISPAAGRLQGRSFLVRTPQLIEDALRSVLSRRLAPIEVKKRRLFMGTSGVTMNPDLVFSDGLAVADVKYRLIGEKWHRASLYQAVAFAAALRCRSCAILGFKSGGDGRIPPTVSVGEITARAFAWDAGKDVAPEASEERFATEIGAWLVECTHG